MAKDITNWKEGLSRTRKLGFGRIANLLGITEINQDTWDELEALLIQADLGIETAQAVLAALQDRARQAGWTKAEQLKKALREDLAKRLAPPSAMELPDQSLAVILLVGVNGSGKTTTVAKLGRYYQNRGKRVVLAAADTFRAAAIEQLQHWGARLDIRVVAGEQGGDAGAVAYDALQSALAGKDDVLLIDTAGRMHTRYNLMEELKKVHKVVGKSLPGAPHAVWLVMDATTGQNAMPQAKAFKAAVAASGIILAKLDSSARGGMAFSVQSELGLPILFAGLGEGQDDLKPFDREAFIDGILGEFG
ncbi:MAG: signal recognition particle-docking protein FtsY [Chloroflexi bacterium]|nr:signal recognition particle-docking protein FtsY [Chloroflexota bacterium]